MSLQQGLINHVVLVVDRSYSMRYLTNEVATVSDNLTQHLANTSQEMDQETRISVYVFDDVVECINYDKDVLRLPSMKGRNTARGNTALIDATMQAIRDLKQTATLYGDHAFIVYVLTDGQENQSRNFSASELQLELRGLPDNWTVAALVPDKSGERYAVDRVGFSKGNVAIWSTTTEGVREVGRVVTQATDNFMRARAQGIRGSKNIFQVDVTHVDTSHLVKVPSDRYSVHPVQASGRIDEFAVATVGDYRRGKWYYQLSKPEDVQQQKIIVIMDNANKEVYTGGAARDMLGLPKWGTIRVHPDQHPRYTIFVQSTSMNRKLVAGTLALYMP